MSILWQFCEPLIPTTLTFNLPPHLRDSPGPCLGKGENPSSVSSAHPLTLLPLFFPDRPGSQLLFLTHLPCAQRIWLHCQNVTMTKTTLKRVRHQQYLQTSDSCRQVGAVCTVAKTSKDNLEFHKRSVNRERRTPFHTGPVSTHPGLKGEVDPRVTSQGSSRVLVGEISSKSRAGAKKMKETFPSSLPLSSAALNE